MLLRLRTYPLNPALIGVLFGAFFALPAHSASMRIKPGLWQMHTEVIPPFATEALVREATECVSDADSNRSFSQMIGDIQGGDSAQECEITKIDEGDGRATAEMHCELPSIGVTSDASFEIRFTDTEFEMSGVMTATIASQPMATRFSNKGTWTSSDCR